MTVRASTIRTIALLVALAVLGWQLTRLPRAIGIPRDDFADYWAAGRLSILGENPYAPDSLWALKKAAGWPAESAYTMFWYPPWTLALMMPFGLLPYMLARLSWLLLSFAAVALCSIRLWRYYGGPAEKTPLALALAAVFAPFVLLLIEGQIGGFILLGLVGFLYLAKRRRWFLAGLCTFPVTAKLYLLYVFWIALLLWVLRERHWRVLAGALLGCLAASLLVLVPDPRIFGQFLGGVGSGLRDYPYTLALGSVLRALFGRERLWLQSLPLLAGSLWTVLYWRKRRETWDWGERMPALLLASFVASASAWMHDQVVLLIAVEAVVASLTHSTAPNLGRFGKSPNDGGRFSKSPYMQERGRALPAIAALVAISAIALACLPALRFNSLWYAWMPPAFVAWYVWAKGRCRPETNGARNLTALLTRHIMKNRGSDTRRRGSR